MVANTDEMKQDMEWSRHSAVSLTAVATLLTGAGLACSDDPGRFETRVAISGRVILSDQPGLGDLSRVQIELGRGEGSIPIDFEDGRFSASDLEPDLYQLRISYQGSFDSDADGSAYVPTVLDIAAQAGGTVFLGDIRLQLGTGTVRGQVRLPSGGDVAGALVKLKGPRFLLETEADSGGAFQFLDVPVGRYELSFEPRQGAVASSQGECAPAVLLSFDGQEVTADEFELAERAVRFDPVDMMDLIQTSLDEQTWFLNPGRFPEGETQEMGVRANSEFATTWRWRRIGDGWPAFEAFDSGLARLPVQEGLNLYEFQLRDACGFEREVPLALDLDRLAPSVFAVRLESPSGRSDFTRESEVRLLFGYGEARLDQLELRWGVCPGDAPECETYQVPEFSRYTQLPTLPPEIELLPEQGEQVVRVQFRDQSGNVALNDGSPVFDLPITFDQQSPADVQVELLGFGRVGGRFLVTERQFEIKVTASEELANIKRGLVSGLPGEPWRTFEEVSFIRLPADQPDGSYTLYLKLQDEAGNETDEIEVPFELDTTGAVTGTVLLEGLDTIDPVDVELLVAGGETRLTTTSTVDGSWRISNVPGGTYPVRFTYRGTTPGVEYRPLTLAVSVLPTQTASVGEVIMTQSLGRVVGRVDLEGLSDDSGALVTLPDVINGQRFEYAGISDSTGAFVVEAPPGTYIYGLTLERDNYVTIERSGSGVCSQDCDPDIVLSRIRRVDLGNFPMRAVANDFVGNAKLGGQTDHSGIQVSVFEENGGVLGRLVGTASTAINGEYRVRDLQIYTSSLTASPQQPYLVTFQYPPDDGFGTDPLRQQVLSPGPEVRLPDKVLASRFLIINNGRDVTTDRVVELELDISGCTEMQIANGPVSQGWSGGVWEPCQRRVPNWTLTLPDNEVKTVKARFRTVSQPTTPSDPVSDTILFDESAAIDRFAVSGATEPLEIGDELRFSLTAADAETGGTAFASIANYDTNIPLFDNGTRGDRTAGDGVYEVLYRIQTATDVNDAPVTGTFSDAYGNVAVPVTATERVTVAVPPLLSDIRIEPDSQVGEARIFWETQLEDTTGSVQWGTSSTYGNPVETTVLGRTHEVLLSGLQAGTEYHFQISAEDVAGNVSSTGDRTFVVRPGTPGYFAAIPGINRNHVRWEAPRKDGIAGYNIYRATSASGPFTKLNALPYNHEALIYEDDTASAGNDYWYYVTSEDASGNESGRTSIQQVTTASTSSGPTQIQGAFGNLEVWSETESPYELTGSVAVDVGGTLVIGPNVTVEVPPAATPYAIDVRGRLAILGMPGTAAQPGRDQVILRSTLTQLSTADYWEGIRFFPTGTGGLFSFEYPGYLAGNILYQVDMSGVRDAIQQGDANQFDSATDDDTLYVLGSRITDCDLSCLDFRRAPIRIDSSFFDPAPATARATDHVLSQRGWVSGSTFRSRSGAGISVASRNNDPARLLVESSRIIGENYGIRSGPHDDLIIRSSTVSGGIGSPVEFGRLGFTQTHGVVWNCTLVGDAETSLAASFVNNLFSRSGVSLNTDRFTNTCVNTMTEVIGNVFSSTTSSRVAYIDGNHDNCSTDPQRIAFNRFSGSPGMPFVDLDTTRRANQPFQLASTEFESNNFEAPLGAAVARVRSSGGGSTYFDVDMRNNYWGTATTEVTSASVGDNISVIDDFFDDVLQPRIEWSPPASSPFPSAQIHQVQWGQRFPQAEPIRMLGSGFDPGRNVALTGTALRWEDDAGRNLGSGGTLRINDPNVPGSPTLGLGIHRIWLYATDQDGQEGGIPIEIEIVP